MFLFFAFVALVFLLIFVVARGTRNYRTTLKAKMPKSMKYGAIGVAAGAVVAAIISSIADDQSAPFVFLFFFGPILMGVGLIGGIIVGFFRRGR